MCTRVLAHVHLPVYMKETVELLLPHLNWFSVCDVSYGQVFTVGICITKGAFTRVPQVDQHG